MALTIAESTNYQNFYYLKRATAGGTVFTTVSKTATAFDYFEDACVVDDAFYFGWREARFREVRLFVGTAFAATAVTFVWEYYRQGGWTALAGVVDGTANFTALGQGDVAFTVPANWRTGSVDGAYALWLRVRISAVDTPTEGGAQSTQTVQLRDHEILVTGVDESNNLFQAIYDADQAGGWGHTSYANTGIRIACNVGIGDGVILTSAISKNECVDIIEDDFRVRNNATLACGTLHENGYTRDGSVIRVSGKTYQNTDYTQVGSIAYFYDTRLQHSDDSGSGSRWASFKGTVAFQDFTIQDFTWWAPRAATITIKRARNKAQRFFPQASLALCEDIYCQGEQNNICTVVYSGVVSGAVVESGAATPYRGYQPDNAQLIDSGPNPLDADLWTWSLSTGKYLLVRYTFNLRVVDAAGTGISGVTVAMADANGDAVFSVATDVNGDIVEQTVTRQRYEHNPTPPPTATQIDYGPLFTVTLSKAGYITRTIVYEIDRKREEIEELLPKGPKKDIEGGLYMEINSRGDLLRIAA